MWVIYRTSCTPNCKIYIGQHKTTNPNDGYLGSGTLLRRAIKKYGKSNFVKDVLAIVHNKTEADLVEEHFIKLHNSTDLSIGYNITKHAFGGQPMSEENKTKLSARYKNRVLSLEQRMSLRVPKAPRSLIHRANLSKARKGGTWYHNPKTKESKQMKKDAQIPVEWVKGRAYCVRPKHVTFSVQALNNIRKANSSPDKRKQTSLTLKGHVVSQTTRDRIRVSLARTRNSKKISIVTEDSFCNPTPKC